MKNNHFFLVLVFLNQASSVLDLVFFAHIVLDLVK